MRNPTALILGALLCAAAQDPATRSLGSLDASGAFFEPGFAAQPDAVLADLDGGAVAAATYLRYLAARLGTEHLEDLAFELALARECEARGLARNAPLLARSAAARRFAESDRRATDDPDGTLQRRFANDALAQLRAEALVQADRVIPLPTVRTLFESRFGIDGKQVRWRHVLVSFTATEQRLQAAGVVADRAAVEAAARERAQLLHGRHLAGASFAELQRESDEQSRAALLSGHDARRYGADCAAALDELQPGQVSKPLASRYGLHLIELVERKVTAFADVEQALRRELGAGPASPAETLALRRALLAKYHFKPRP